jgi:DNA-binding transcriptional MocR family regulator
MTVSPDEVVITSGAQEAMALCLRAVAQPGDTIALESPTYYGVLQLIEVLGLKALEISTDPREGVWCDALENALNTTKIAACLFVTNFNNPLGSLMPDGCKEKLVKLLAARGVPLIEDDIYGDLSFSPVRPKTAKAYDGDGQVLLCSSFSKTLAPGYRVGWCIPGLYQKEVERQKLFTSISTATIPQMAIAEFLATGGYDHHLRKVRKACEDQVKRMSDAVCEYFPEGTKLTRPQGGSVLWVELNDGIDSLRLHDLALAENVSIAPGPIFSPTGKYRHFVRLNCGLTWSDEVDRAMRTLGRLIKEMGGA